MEYVFRNIESLIRGTVGSAINLKNKIGERFAGTRLAVAEEKLIAQESFGVQVISISDRDQTLRFVQYHQGRLTMLINDLFELTLNVKDTLESEIFFLSDQLSDLLMFIRRQFPDYFDIKANVPRPQSGLFVKEHSRELDALRLFISGSEIQDKLKQVLLDALKRILAKEQFSYQQIEFLQQLTEQLARLKEFHRSDLTNETRDILIESNFNSKEFLSYNIGAIQSTIEAMGSDVERMEFISRELKIVNQITIRSAAGFETNLPSIKEQLSDWLLEELQFLKNTRLSTVNLATKESEFIKSDFKIELDMSVAQFALMTKSFVESGVIQNKNLSELIRFLAKFVRTKKSGSISHESFRIKYYNVEGSTKDAVKNVLHTAIGYINSN